MSTKITNISNTDKILNSDIYDITAFVDDIKKKSLETDIEYPPETLVTGMYGYLNYQFSSLLQNAIVVASELANEAIATRAKFDRNVITHALSLGVNKITATPASMKVFLMFPERALRNNMVNGNFRLKSSTPIYFNECEFHIPYDIIISYSDLTNTVNGTNMKYVYTAKYDLSVPNPISDIDNEYLPPIAIYKDLSDNFITLTTTIHQVEYTEIVEKIVGSDEIANKTLNFTFEGQMSHFTMEVIENNSDKSIPLVPVYDGLYNQETELYCYYQYINTNTIRLRFDPNVYQPRTNADVKIHVWTTQGSGGNFMYSEDLTVRLTSDDYTNLYMIVQQRSEDGSTGGLDRKTVPELQRIIPKEALSRGSITLLSDLRNYFNSINNENSVLHVFRKEDNILTRIYYTYCLMKDANNNVTPTNTIPIYLSSENQPTKTSDKYYLESGTPLYLNNSGPIPFLSKNYVGYTTYNAVTYSIDSTPPGEIKPEGQETYLSYTYLNLEKGDFVRVKIYDEETGTYSDYVDGEVMYVEYKGSSPHTVTLLVYNPIDNCYDYGQYRLPDAVDLNMVNAPALRDPCTCNPEDVTYDENYICSECGKMSSSAPLFDKVKHNLKNNDIIYIQKSTKFVYTNPLSIVLTDSEEIDSHRVDAKYYLDIIDEQKMLNFNCINSNSPIQFIASHVKVTRPSYLNKDRYKYNIDVDITPNIGTVTSEMINRTRVVGVFYKNNNPIMYTFGKYNGNKIYNTNVMSYTFNLYTKSFMNVDTDSELVSQEVMDDNGNIYIGNAEFKDEYDLYEPNTNTILPFAYLNTTTKFRIYILYKYDFDANTTKDQYMDDLSHTYFGTSNFLGGEIPLSTIVPTSTEFKDLVVKPEQPSDPYFSEDNSSDGIEDIEKILGYSLNDMVLTNVYEAQDGGITLLYDYSNLMNSYVTMVQTAGLPSYVVNRVPVVKNFYCIDEDRINGFIKEMKKKILYVLAAIDPLETTFGLDFKFFNTYGPSNMYKTTNPIDGTTQGVIDNVSLSLTFRTKFYNEESDKNNIIPLIINDIKDYIEKLEDLEDIHFPNLTTEIENNYSEYLIYFEFVGFNGNDANYQHIITDENMEMLTVVPEFLNVATDDYTGEAVIDIRIVT